VQSYREARRKKKSEPRRKNLPELMRWQWSDGKCADEDPISADSVQERKRTGGLEGEEVNQR
jgi:hypothetical protein